MFMTYYFVCICWGLILGYPHVSGDEDNKAALIIIDVQDCFISGGSLAVKNGNDIIPVINKIREDFKDKFSLVVLSQDWHPPGHVSFKSVYPGSQRIITLRYTKEGKLCLGSNNTITIKRFPGAISCEDNDIDNTSTLTQVLWPDHCLQGVSDGPTSSAFAKTLVVEDTDLIIQKGIQLEVDSYSAFFDNGGFEKTNLDKELKARGITHVFVTGLAADYCVYYTSLDSHKLGYETFYVMDATKPVSEDTMNDAIHQLVEKGVHLVTTSRLSMTFEELKEGASAGPQILGSIGYVMSAVFGKHLLMHLCL